MTKKLQTYFELVGFPCLEEFEQIKLLFFITKVADIREDMTAKVIASRLARLQKVTCEGMAEYTQHLQKTMHNNTDIFKEIRMRKPREHFTPDDL